MNPNHEHACGCEHTHEEESQYNKYEDALSKYQTNLKDDEIAEKNSPTHRKAPGRKQYEGSKEISFQLY